MTYLFGPFVADPANRTVRKTDTALAIQRKTFDILLILLEEFPRPITGDALIGRAWPGLAVDRSNLHTQIRLLRKVLGENSAGRSWVETSPDGYVLSSPETKTEGASRRGFEAGLIGLVILALLLVAMLYATLRPVHPARVGPVVGATLIAIPLDQAPW